MYMCINIYIFLFFFGLAKKREWLSGRAKLMLAHDINGYLECACYTRGAVLLDPLRLNLGLACIFCTYGIPEKKWTQLPRDLLLH